MLKNHDLPIPDEQQLKDRLEKARDRLEYLSLAVREKKLPVLVLVEGWGAAGKGSLIGRVISRIDPRFFDVTSMSSPTEEELRRPFLYRYMCAVPEAGKLAFLDSGWMDEVVRGRLRGALDEDQYQSRIRSVKHFERTLSDNGYLVLKLFLHISEKEQKRRLDKLSDDPDTAWRVSENDLWQNQHYDRCCKVFADC